MLKTGLAGRYSWVPLSSPAIFLILDPTFLDSAAGEMKGNNSILVYVHQNRLYCSAKYRS